MKIAIVVDETLLHRGGVLRRILHNHGLDSQVLAIQNVPEGGAGKSVLNQYDATIVLQHETNQNSSGNKRIYTWIAYTPGDKPLGHFGCVNRLAGSSSADYNTTLGALSPAFPIVRFNTADIPNTAFPFSQCTYTAPSSGTFTLSFGGLTTPAIAFSASSSTIQTELEALSSVGTGQVSVRPVEGSARTHDIFFINPASHSLLSASAGTLSAIETDGYRGRLQGIRASLSSGLAVWSRSFTWRNGTNFGAFKVNPALLDANREVVIRPVIAGATVPETAALGVRYFNRYFLPMTGVASNSAILRAQRESSYDWLQTTQFHWVLWFLSQAGISPAHSTELFHQYVGFEHDHPIDDFTATFPGTLTEQRERRRKNEFATYEWLTTWSKKHAFQLQVGINTGGRDQPRFVSSDPKTHWQALYSDPANTDIELDFARRTHAILQTDSFAANAHCHTREKGFVYSDYPRHSGGTYGVGNHFEGDKLILPTLTVNDTILYPRRFTLSITATGGTYSLTYNNETTIAIAFNATAATIQTAIANLSNVGAGQVMVSGSTSNFEIVFNQPATRGAFTLNGAGLTGGTGTLTSKMRIASEQALLLHTERDYYEMLALGFGSLHGGPEHMNDARNAPGVKAERVYPQYNVRSCRVADTKLQSAFFKQRGSEVGFRLWREGDLELFATPSTSFDFGNKGLLTTGGTGGNDSSVNTTWLLNVGVANPSAPSALELTIARSRALTIAGDRLTMAWAMGMIPYMHGSNSHAANVDNPTESFGINQNWNAMIEMHTIISEYLELLKDWYILSSAPGLRQWRLKLREYLISIGERT